MKDRVECWRVAPDGVAQCGVLRSQHGHVLVVRNPGCDDGRTHVEAVVGIRRILHPPEYRELQLEVDLRGGPGREGEDQLQVVGSLSVPARSVLHV